MFGMDMYFDRSGAPISQQEWISKFGDMAYKRVGADSIWVRERYSRFRVLDVLITIWRALWDKPIRKLEVWVSTVWMGMDHGYRSEVPIIFETMVFGEGTVWDEFQERYSTEEQARAGHASVVAYIRARKSPEQWWHDHPYREDAL